MTSVLTGKDQLASSGSPGQIHLADPCDAEDNPLKRLWYRYFSGSPPGDKRRPEYKARAPEQGGLPKVPSASIIKSASREAMPKPTVTSYCNNTLSSNARNTAPRSVRFVDQTQGNPTQQSMYRSHPSVFSIVAAPPRPSPYYPPSAYASTCNLVSSQSSLSHPLSSLSQLQATEMCDNEAEAQYLANTLECVRPTALGLSISSLIMGLPVLNCFSLYFALKSPSKGAKRKHYCLSIVLAVIAILLAITVVVGVVLLMQLPKQMTKTAGFGHNIRYSDGTYTCWCKNEYLKDCECSKRFGNGKYQNWNDCHCTTSRICDCIGWAKSMSFFV